MAILDPLAEEFAQLRSIRKQTRYAIQFKGVGVDASLPWNEYPNKIQQIIGKGIIAIPANYLEASYSTLGTYAFNPNADIRPVVMQHSAFTTRSVEVFNF